MLTKTALAQSLRFKIGWFLLHVMDFLLTLNHFALIFILDEPSLFIGFTLFNTRIEVGEYVLDVAPVIINGDKRPDVRSIQIGLPKYYSV